MVRISSRVRITVKVRVSTVLLKEADNADNADEGN